MKPPPDEVKRLGLDEGLGLPGNFNLDVMGGFFFFVELICVFFGCVFPPQLIF